MTSSGGPPFRVDFTIDLNDVVVYLRLLQRRLNRIGVALGLIVMGIGAVLAALTLDAFTGTWTFVLGLLFVVLAGTEFLDRWRIQRSGKSLIGSKASLTFGEDGIDADTVTGSGHAQWSSVTTLKHNDKVMIVMRDRYPIAWIPLRVFATAEDAAALEAYISNHIAVRPG